MFLDDKKYVFEKAPKMLTECPITLAPGDCIQKTIYFDISKSAAINLYESKTQKASTQIRIIDVLKTTYQSESADIDLKFSNALLSVCGEI